MNAPAPEALLVAADGLAPRWSAWLVDQFERAIERSTPLLWTRPAWFAARVPPPHVNDQGRRLLADAFKAQMRGEEGDFRATCLEQHAAIAASGYRSVLEPGELNVGEVAFYTQRRPFDLVIQVFVQHLFDVEERHHFIEHELFREDCIIGAMTACELTPPPIALPYRRPPSERPAIRRFEKMALADDWSYWRARSWRPETLIYEPLDTEPWYRMLIPQLAPEWSLDAALSTKKLDVYVRPLGAKWRWYLCVPPPASGNLPSLRMGPPKRGRLSPERDTCGVPVGPVDLHYLGAYNARGIEVFVRHVIAGHFRQVIEFLEPVLAPALDSE